ncbi:hypothetical protein BGW38_002704 [Lunasporangiospora selenospora]|uniref:Uncharacterized protein n=1 Tax=Lunasporangiospora selenospora TaxID=979761 RepID=A0A9P6G341_9FUNG|nr:hypothetical protein BGW38_002704 [Lunasporangiospora selenospora]
MAGSGDAAGSGMALDAAEAKRTGPDSDPVDAGPGVRAGSVGGVNDAEPLDGRLGDVALLALAARGRENVVNFGTGTDASGTWYSCFLEPDSVEVSAAGGLAVKFLGGSMGRAVEDCGEEADVVALL